ncbi:hypothetical protein FPY71_08925 [Aureimonas fodinaquatilis]|uniref:Uncharacterized protein n=1 Tax=Aureimonas fodinaquatilis TaxID=2565783 RepID=A0A5B0DXY5_9HYPH|nr:hypothetical protein [Aureimonas fodinaquatilis]KAA0970611.1 hypothetical protein FPY71_08925 [Aureimonas fodinaquatilis]
MRLNSPRLLLLMAAGFTLWSVGFVAVYGLLSTGCEFGWQNISIGPMSFQRLLLLLVALVNIALAGLLAVWLYRRMRHNAGRSSATDFLWWVSFGAGLVAVPATAFVFAGIPVLTQC